ncbi:Disease resistance protein RML1B, partial [Mucuna pruriens]
MATLCHSLDPKAFTNHYVLLRCAEDTYFGFTGNLRYALGEAEFLDWDHEEIERKAIAESSICIVILSPRFLSSPSCLDELVQIVEEFGKGRMGQLLLPVLYDLESSLVQQLIYNHKITVHPHKFDNWLQALTQVFTVAAHFTACHFQSDGDRYEYECIMKIVQQVSKHVASTLGLNLQEKEVIQLLNSGPDDGVHVIGIFGDPAIGKKIARTAYNLFAGEGFDSYCFLNVGENLSGPRFGHFLHMFCSRIVCNNCGISIMSTPKSTLNQMKVFVVFHDINDPDLLKYAVELTNWFGSGSRVIVTSDHKCLFESHGVKRVYQVEMSDRTTVRYENVIDRAEACVSGHPLPLE